MTDVIDSDEARRRFAVDRSHKDADISNENARATGQAAILINGGAATAILAFLAKDKLDPSVLRIASWCLVGYALGVVSGAGMLFCSIRSLDYYNIYWRLTAHPEPERDAETNRANAYWWWKWMASCFMRQCCPSQSQAALLHGHSIIPNRRNKSLPRLALL